MNGCPPVADARPQRALRPWTQGDAARARLFAAFAFSCLLHGALVFLPYLGRGSYEAQTAAAARSSAPPAMHATLAPGGERVYSAPERPLQSAAAAESAAAGRSAPVPAAAPTHRTDGLGLLPLPAPAFYTTDELSKRPQPLASAELDAPEIRPIVASGKLVLTLLINEAGIVVDVLVDETELPEVFSRTAVAAFKALRFQPGERNGRPVGTLMRIEVDYADGRARNF